MTLKFDFHSVKSPIESDPDVKGIIIPTTPRLLAECAERGMLVIPIRQDDLKVDIVFLYGPDQESVTRLVTEQSEKSQDSPFPGSIVKTVQ